jgi:hypothetical protein
VANSIKPVGRVNFVLRTLLFTAMAFGIEFLGNEMLRLRLLPGRVYSVQWVLVFGLVGLFLFAVIDGRLIDAGKSSWYRYPAYAIWLLSTSLPIVWPPSSWICFASFVLLLVAGGSISRRSTIVSDHASLVTDRGPGWVPPDRSPHFPAELLVSPLGFLRGLLTLACFWLPLIWLDEGSGGSDVRVWIARFGYALLSVVWLFMALGRLGDAGRLPRARYAYLVIGLLLPVGLLDAYWHGGAQLRDAFPFLKEAASALTQSLSSINGYWRLAVFLLIQTPLALFPSGSRLPEPIIESRNAEGTAKDAVPVAPTNELALSGPLKYLFILVAIASTGAPLVYIDGASGGGVGSWIARIGYLILALIWLTFANGRLEDAGWAHSQYPAQFDLVVSVASLMPLAFRWVNGYGALAIFVLVQTPTVFLKSKPKPKEPSLESEQAAQI